MPTTTIAIIHPSELLHLGLISVFTGEAGIMVVGQGFTSQEAQKLVKQHRPDLLLLFDQLDGDGSFDLVEKLKVSRPDLKIVMLGVQENTTYMARAAAAGANDYLFEGSTKQQILNTIKDVAVRKPPSPFSIYGKVVASMQDRTSNPAVRITPRELQVLRHVGYGLSNKEIARSLKISIETIKEHVQNILRKMGMNDRTQAAVWVVKQGLV